MMRILRRSVPSWLAAVPAFALFACGGDGGGPTSPPPGPPPPPPPPPIGASLDMAPGEVRVLTDAASIRTFELVAGSGAREYQVIVMSASLTDGGTTPLTLRARADDVSPNAVPAPSASRASAVGLPTRSRIGLGLDPRRERRGHLRLMARMEEEARRVGARASPRASQRAPGVRASVAATSTVPNVGDPMTIKSGIVPSGGIDCNANTPIAGTVKTVGQNFVIVEDDRIAGELTAQDYAELDQELDDFVAPVDQDYFGQPNDLDGNQRTIAFFTSEVNRLSDPDAGIIVLGFHTLLDHLDPAICPYSNEAEIIWLLGPDPNGDVGIPVDVSFVKLIARSLVAHEYQHLINASQRIAGQSGPILSLADLWVNEGLSHVGEEVSGFHRIGLGVRQNFGFSDIVPSSAERPVFDDFHFGNLLNVKDYLTAPTDFNALAISNEDLDFKTRGWGYQFLRWLGDRYGPAGPVGVVAGSGEQALFRELTVGGPSFLFGPDNILRAINVVTGETPTWAEVLGEFFAATASDDAMVSGLPPEVQFSTWDTPRLWQELQGSGISSLGGGHPLNRRMIQMGSGVSSTNNFDLGSSTARYFTLQSSGAHPAMLVETTAGSGGNVPNGASARIVVVRTR